MSPKEATDLEMVVSNFVRNKYENMCNQHIPMALKYLMLKFANRIIGTSLLSLKQDLDLFKMLTTKLSNIKKFKVLFIASDHSFNAKRFHSLCDHKGPTITIIKSNSNNIFGGYTSKSWTPNGEFIKDEDSFLFLVESENKLKYFDIIKSRAHHAIYCAKSDGPSFGMSDIEISRRSERLYAATRKSSYNYNDLDLPLSGRGEFELVDYQVFQICH